MKTKRHKLISAVKSLFIVMILIGISSCEEAAPELTLEQLLNDGAWTAESIQRDNVDVTADLPNFVLNFAVGTYTSQNGKHIWPSSGTWSIPDAGKDQILRDNDLIMDVVAEPNSLTLLFQLDESQFSLGGRTQSVSSTYIFVLKR